MPIVCHQLQSTIPAIRPKVYLIFRPHLAGFFCLAFFSAMGKRLWKKTVRGGLGKRLPKVMVVLLVPVFDSYG